jgi:hypothetical protein
MHFALHSCTDYYISLQTHFPWFYHPITITWKVKLRNCSLCICLNAFLGSKIHQRAPFSNTFSLHIFLLCWWLETKRDIRKKIAKKSQLLVISRRIFWYVCTNIWEKTSAFLCRVLFYPDKRLLAFEVTIHNHPHLVVLYSTQMRKLRQNS